MSTRDLVTQIEDVERLVGSPGWQRLASYLEKRDEALVSALIHESTDDARRAVTAAQIRELREITGWPAKEIARLEAQRERNDEGESDGD